MIEVLTLVNLDQGRQRRQQGEIWLVSIEQFLKRRRPAQKHSGGRNQSDLARGAIRKVSFSAGVTILT
jgi:hypothetical protein